MYLNLCLRCKYSGWAHVDLHDAVLDGNIDIVKATLLRLIRKCPTKINEHDVSLDPSMSP